MDYDRDKIPMDRNRLQVVAGFVVVAVANSCEEGSVHTCQVAVAVVGAEGVDHCPSEYCAFALAIFVLRQQQPQLPAEPFELPLPALSGSWSYPPQSCSALL